MPTVPRYGPRQVNLQPLPGVRKTAAETPESEGYGLAEAQMKQGQVLGEVGTAATRLGLQQVQVAKEIQDKAHKQANDLAVLNGENQLARWENTRLYGEGGALTLKGKASFGLPETINGEYDQVTSDISAGMTDEQRSAFSQIAARRGLNLDLNIRRHVAGEMQAYGAQEVQSALVNSRERAIANSSDTRQIGDELEYQQRVVVESAPWLGWGEEKTKEVLGALQSSVHVGVVESLAAQPGKMAQARAYYHEVKEYVLPEQREHLEKTLTVGSTRDEAQRRSDVILKAGGTDTEMRDKAKAISNDTTLDNPSEVRDATLAYIEHELARNKEAKRDATEQVYSQMNDTLRAAHGNLHVIPPSVWADFSSEQKDHMHALSEKLQEGAPIQTDWFVYVNMKELADAHPEQFSNTMVELYRDRLSDQHFQEMINLRAAVRKNNRAQANDIQAGFRTVHDIATEALFRSTLKEEKDYTVDDKKAKAEFMRLLSERVEDYENNTKKKADNTLVTQMADDILMREVTVKGSTYNLWMGPTLKIPIPFSSHTVRLVDIPYEQRKAIELSFIKEGKRTWSDQDILERFVRIQAK